MRSSRAHHLELGFEWFRIEWFIRRDQAPSGKPSTGLAMPYSPYGTGQPNGAANLHARFGTSPFRDAASDAEAFTSQGLRYAAASHGYAVVDDREIAREVAISELEAAK